MRKLALLFFILAPICSASAQITYTLTDFQQYYEPYLNDNTYEGQDNTLFQVYVPMSGANLTWDFSTQQYVNTGNFGLFTFFAYPGEAPFADDPSFTAATHVMKNVPGDPAQPTTYEFYKITSDGVWDLGSSQDSLGIKAVISTYTPAGQLFKFPLTMGTSWHGVCAYTNVKSFSQGETVKITVDGLVDGYGTLVIPGGKSFPALRRKGSTLLRITPSDGTPSYTIGQDVYNWITQSVYGAEVYVNDQGGTQGYYETPTANAVAASGIASDLHLAVSQNPVTSGAMGISYTAPRSGMAEVLLSDVLGRPVKTLESGNVSAGEVRMQVNTAAIPAGTYFLHVVCCGESVTQKLIISR